MWTLPAATSGFGPQSGTVVHPTAAPGYLAVSPPSATAKIARTAAPNAACAVFDEPR